MSHISVIHPIAPRSKNRRRGVKDLNGNPATNPSINLLLLNCASQYTPISTTSNRSTARAYSFTVASSPDGIVQATIADGNDTIACNNQGGTLWQITAHYQGFLSPRALRDHRPLSPPIAAAVVASPCSAEVSPSDEGGQVGAQAETTQPVRLD